MNSLPLSYRYKMIVAYDGTDFYGSQAQKELPSVCGLLEKTFTSLFKHPVRMRGISRTDAGVHALGQVVSVRTSLSIAAESLQFAMNNVLPNSVVIRSVQKIDADKSLFDGIEKKIYYYHFFLDRPLPNVARYGWYYQYSVDIEKLRSCLSQFCGTHDFTSFRNSDDPRTDTIRTIESIRLTYLKSYKIYRITVVGQSFMRHMIRRIVGACIEVASRPTVPVTVLREALAEKNSRQQLPTAPAHGLVLRKIIYFQSKEQV